MEEFGTEELAHLIQLKYLTELNVHTSATTDDRD